MHFQLTSAAAREILAAAQRSGAEGAALRVAARPGADGIAYGMGFDDPAPDDTVAVFEGLTVLVGRSSERWLAGTVLDFVEIEAGTHDFIFVPPEPAAAESGCATKASGCGSGGCSGCN